MILARSWTGGLGIHRSVNGWLWVAGTVRINSLDCQLSGAGIRCTGGRRASMCRRLRLASCRRHNGCHLFIFAVVSILAEQGKIEEERRGKDIGMSMGQTKRKGFSSAQLGSAWSRIRTAEVRRQTYQNVFQPGQLLLSAPDNRSNKTKTKIIGTSLLLQLHHISDSPSLQSAERKRHRIRGRILGA